MTQGPGELAGAPSTPLRVAFVPGVTPGKWSRIWAQRVLHTPLEVTPIVEADQVAVLHERRADMCLVRMPVDVEGLSLIPLYRETTVVVVPQEHPISAYDEVAVADLAAEHLLQDPDTVPAWRDIADEVREGTRLDVPPMTLKEAVGVVASGTGIVIVPMSVARLHHRKEVTHRPVTDVADSQIGLAWLAGAVDPRIEKFIGIVRGRTERSSRADESGEPVEKTGPRRQPTTSNPSGKKEARRPSGSRPTRRGGGRGRRHAG